MTFIERVLRCMTQLNIGATLATAAWLLWTGPQVVSGELRPPPRPATTHRLPAADTPPGPARPTCPCSDEDSSRPLQLAVLADRPRAPIPDQPPRQVVR